MPLPGPTIFKPWHLFILKDILAGYNIPYCRLLPGIEIYHSIMPYLWGLQKSDMMYSDVSSFVSWHYSLMYLNIVSLLWVFDILTLTTPWRQSSLFLSEFPQAACVWIPVSLILEECFARISLNRLPTHLVIFSAPSSNLWIPRSYPESLDRVVSQIFHHWGLNTAFHQPCVHPWSSFLCLVNCTGDGFHHVYLISSSFYFYYFCQM